MKQRQAMTMIAIAAAIAAVAFVPNAASEQGQQPPPPPPPPPIMTSPPGAAAVEQRAPGNRAPAQLIESFDGLGVGFEGPQGSATANNPSDNSLAVGPDHVFQIVNSRMAIFTKKGKRFDTTGRALYGPVPTNTMFKGFGGACEANNNGDAVVRYDQLADRWLIVMPIFRRAEVRPDQPPVPNPGELSSECAGPARSARRRSYADSSPAPEPPQPPDSVASAPARNADNPGRKVRTRCATRSARAPIRSALTTATSSCARSFPTIRGRPSGRTATTCPTSTGDDVIQKHACVVDRAKMLKGEPATEQCVIIDGVNFLNNADLDGKTLPPAGAPNIMMAAGGTQLKKILRRRRHLRLEVPRRLEGSVQTRRSTDRRRSPWRRITTCATASSRTACRSRAPSGGSTRRATRSWRGSSIAASATASRSSPSTRSTRPPAAAACAGTSSESTRTANVTLYQQGTYAPDSFYRWMASPAIDKLGNIGIGYSFGGTPHFAGQRFAGRLPNDPPGSLTLRETVLVEGEGVAETPCAGRTTRRRPSTRATTARSGTSATTSRRTRRATRARSARFACRAVPAPDKSMAEAPVHIVPYDPSWPDQFEQERRTLCRLIARMAERADRTRWKHGRSRSRCQTRD